MRAAAGLPILFGIVLISGPPTTTDIEAETRGSTFEDWRETFVLGPRDDL